MAGTGHNQSFRTNRRMLRSSGGQRVKYRSKMTGINTNPATPLSTYHDSKRMQKAVTKGIRREIIAYLLVLVLLSLAGLILYGLLYG